MPRARVHPRTGHGGADARMTGRAASAAAPPTRWAARATARDGALALLTGLAANASIATGQPRAGGRPARPTLSRTGADRDASRPAVPGRARASARSPASCTRTPRDLPLISPHGHVDPAILADDAPFPDPARLLIVPDHYVTRMLLSQGIPPAALGVPTRRRRAGRDRRRGRSGGCFAENWHLFRGTPSRLWLEQTFADVFDVHTPLAPGHRRRGLRRARRPARRAGRSGPRALFERFNIEVLATTESPLDDLGRHAKLAADGWGGPGGRVITTFRPDDVVDMEWAGWADRVARLGELTGEDTDDLRRLPGRAAAAPGGVHRRRRHLLRPRPPDRAHPRRSTPREAAALFDAGPARRRPTRPTPRRSGRTCWSSSPGCPRGRPGDAAAPGLGAQPQPVAVRHARPRRRRRHPAGHRVRARAARRCSTRTATTRGCGSSSTRWTSTRSPASWRRWPAATRRSTSARRGGSSTRPEALRRFREAVTETAGFYNTAGFVDDTRAFCSIPVRHDVARRIDAGFLARLVAEDRLPLDEAAETIADLAYHLPKTIFRLEG